MNESNNAMLSAALDLALTRIAAIATATDAQTRAIDRLAEVIRQKGLKLESDDLVRAFSRHAAKFYRTQAQPAAALKPRAKKKVSRYEQL